MTNKEFDRSLGNLKKQTSTNIADDNEKKEDNGLTLTRKEEEKKISRNYILKQDHINFIDRAARKTGREKSEIVRIALEYLEKNIDFE